MRRLPLILICLIVGGSQSASAADPINDAINKGIGWLLRHQRPDGCFVEKPSGKEAKPGDVPNYGMAFGALVLIAMHDAGHHVSDNTKEGHAMLKCVENMAVMIEPSRIPEMDGAYLGRTDRSRMYGHGMITLALASVASDIADDQLKQTLLAAVREASKQIIASQNVKKSKDNQGGWRYEPQSSDSDISVTVWQLLALRAAKDHSGVEVPAATWESAIAYLKRSSKPAAHGRAFSYEPLGGLQIHSTTAAGVLGLVACGVTDAQELGNGLTFLEHCEIDPKGPWFHYGLAHMSHAFALTKGEPATRFRTKIKELLLPIQFPDGSWMPVRGNERAAGEIYATAMAIRALVPWRKP